MPAGWAGRGRPGPDVARSLTEGAEARPWWHFGGQSVGCSPTGFMTVSPEGPRTCPGVEACANPRCPDPKRRQRPSRPGDPRGVGKHDSAAGYRVALTQYPARERTGPLPGRYVTGPFWPHRASMAARRLGSRCFGGLAFRRHELGAGRRTPRHRRDLASTTLSDHNGRAARDDHEP